MKQTLLPFLVLLFSSISLFSQNSFSKSLLAQNNNYPFSIDELEIDYNYALQDQTQALLCATAELLLLAGDKHNFATPTKIVTLGANSKIEILNPKPFIAKNSITNKSETNYSAFFYVKCGEKVGYISSLNLFFLPTTIENKICGVEIVPIAIKEKNKIELLYNFILYQNGKIAKTPLYRIENLNEERFIPTQIVAKDFNSDGKSDFAILGFLSTFNLIGTQGVLSKGEAWIMEKLDNLFWVYSYQSEVVYPVGYSYSINYSKTKDKSSNTINAIKKTIWQTNKKTSEKTMLLFSTANFKDLVLSPRNFAEIKIHFPCNAVVTAASLKLRANSSASSSILESLKKGTNVTAIEISSEEQTIEGQKANWYKVKTQSGKTGWVFGAYIEF